MKYLGRFVTPQVFGTKSAQGRIISNAAFAQDDANQNLLPVVRIGQAGGRNVQHAGVAQQYFVDSARRYVLATFNDQLFDTPGNKEKTVGIAVAQIAGAQPAVRRKSGEDGVRVFV